MCRREFLHRQHKGLRKTPVGTPKWFGGHTKKRLPVKLVYCEPYDRIDHAFHREKQVQGWSRRKKQALIERNPEYLIEFSKNYTQYGRPEERLPSTPSTSSGTEETATAAVTAKKMPFPEPVEGNIEPPPDLPEPPPELVEGKGEGNTTDNSTDNMIRKNLEVLGYGE